MRLRLKLEEFDFNIIHKARRLNSVADALSRINTIHSVNLQTEYAEYLKDIESNTIINNNIIDLDKNQDLVNSVSDIGIIYFSEKNLCLQIDYKDKT